MSTSRGRTTVGRATTGASVVLAAVVALASSSTSDFGVVEAFAPTTFKSKKFAASSSSPKPTSSRSSIVGNRKASSSATWSTTTRLRAFDPTFLQDVPQTMDAAATSALGSSGGIGIDAAASNLLGHTFAAGADAASAGIGSVLDSATTFLSHGHASADAAAHAHHSMPEYDASDPVQVLVHSPTPWSVLVMLSIVGLLVTWEEFVESLKEGLPAALMSVVDSMLAEMGGLGFIGLFLQLFVTGGVLGIYVGELSEQFLGEEEVLLETFEFLHTVFFQVGIGFFAICGATVFAVLNRIKELGKISELALDTDGDGEVSLEEMADALHVEAMVVDENGDGVLDETEITNALRKARMLTVPEEVRLGDEERGAEALVVRERLIRNLGLPDDFKVEYYFERVFARNLEEIVEFSPLTWLPLIPLIALDDTVDLTHGVISAASANAAASSGWFLATPWFFVPALISSLSCLVWGLYNLWKVTSIKLMLEPILVRDGGDDGPARLLPPRYEDPILLRNFDSSPNVFGWIESFFPRKEPTNDHQRLFGVPGANGPSMYRDSIKFHTWLCVAQIIFFGGQIVVRDVWALLEPSDVVIGCPEYVYQEKAVFTFFVLLALGQLALAPTTFLNYCFSSSIETMVDPKMMAEAELDSVQRAEREKRELKLAAEEEVLGMRRDATMDVTTEVEAKSLRERELARRARAVGRKDKKDPAERVVEISEAEKERIVREEKEAKVRALREAKAAKAEQEAKCMEAEMTAEEEMLSMGGGGGANGSKDAVLGDDVAAEVEAAQQEAEAEAKKELSLSQKKKEEEEEEQEKELSSATKSGTEEKKNIPAAKNNAKKFRDKMSELGF